jgi:hypothetical protein
MNRYEYACSHCNYFIETSGPWPYYRRNNRKAGKPESIDVTSEPIYGLTAKIYCPTCDKEKKIILSLNTKLP